MKQNFYHICQSEIFSLTAVEVIDETQGLFLDSMKQQTLVKAIKIVA